MIVILMVITKILLPVTIITIPMVLTIRMHNDTNVNANNDTKNDTNNNTQTGLHRQVFKNDKH